MRRMDRYLLTVFVVRFVVAAAILCAVHLSIDLADSAGHLARNPDPGHHLSRFVLERVPIALSRVVPVAVLVAVLSSLTGLARRGELLALFNAGISSTRVSAPFLAGAIGCATLLALLSNLVVPRVYGSVGAAARRVSSAGSSVNGAWHLDGNALWRAETSPDRTGLEQVDVLEFDEDGCIVSHTRADRSVWTDGRWVAPEARVWRLNEREGVVLASTQDKTLPLPRVIPSATRFVAAYETLAYTELAALARTTPPRSRSGYAYRLALALRWLLPSSCFLLVFAGTPLALRRLRGREGLPLDLAALLLAGFAVTLGLGGLGVALWPRGSPVLVMALPQAVWLGVGFRAFRRINRSTR